MSSLKKLASQTAIYGLSSIVGRLIGYLFIPLYTRVFDTAQYGIVTEMYAYVAFLVVLLTYGMETTFFRFSNRDDADPNKVFGTAAVSLIISSFLFIFICSWFAQPIAEWLRYPNHSEYISWFALIVGLDAISSIPLAKLRRDNQPVKFAVVNLVNILIYVILNLFFIVYCKNTYEEGGNWITDLVYNPNIGVGYIFISNLIASIIKFALLSIEFKGIEWKLDKDLWLKMLKYGSPMMIVGFMGIINETFDRSIFKYLMIPILGEEKAMSELGIYGACYKVAIIMNLVVQAFRYAAEPFFFGKVSSEEEKKKNLALVFKMLSVLLSFIFLGVMLYIDWVLVFVGENFRVGVEVVPILLLANLFLGLLFNVSMWYKLTNKTSLGSLISLVGAIITISLNFILIPIMSYVGAAWATLVCYFVMLILSLIWGHKYYPVKYPIKKSTLYIVSALLLYFISLAVLPENGTMKYVYNLIFLAAFAGLVYGLERRKKVLS